ncbi:MAG TPA: carbohydrate ABC transporter permease [Tepidisphaeraceae bacterium]|nr:carbohydrate ABC transporter permease [Tepidisphaeraceae bacterium]
MKRLANEIFILFVCLLCIAPVLLIFITAFKPDAEIIHFYSLLPRHWTFENFRQIFTESEEIPIFRWLGNSCLISGSVTLLILTVDSLAAYALCRLDLPGRRWIFAIILATLMVPGQVLLVPVYLILNSLHWLDTPLALIIPAGAGAFGVFLLHQFFKGIPRELEEAAEIDGCSPLGIYWHIILPLSRPALATLGIFVFVSSWNDFLGPLVFLDSIDKYTLPVGVALFQGSYVTEYGLTLAASVVCTLPIILVFLAFHKHIIKGIAAGGIKE